jgi:PAS domain S-box-containing protein
MDGTVTTVTTVTDGLGAHVQALVYTNVNDVIFHLRVEGGRFRFIQINPAFTRATGLTEQQVVGKFVDEVIPEPSLSLVLGKYRAAIDERRTIRWEEVTAYPTGTKIGEVSVTPVVEADGACSLLVGTVSDVTESRAQREKIQMYADIVRSVPIALTVWTVENPDDLESVRLAGFNPQAAQMVSDLNLPNAIGRPMLALLPAVRDTPLPALIATAARDGVPRELADYRSVLHPAHVLAVKAFPLPGNLVGLSLEDITDPYRATQLQVDERRALELLASGAGLEEVLSVIVESIEEQDPGTVASILLLDETGSHLRHGAAPHLPEAYNKAIDGVAISSKGGSCGTAAFTGKAVHVADITTDPLWEDYRELAAMLDMRACWSTPILTNDGHVLGTFALYRRECSSPSPSQLDLIARATHIAAIVLERRRVEDELHALTTHIEQVREDERTGIAREIHDELGQALTAIKMDIAWLSRRVPEDELIHKLREMTEMMDELISSVRRIASELRPGILDDVGLAAAVEWQAGEFEARTGTRCDVHCDIGHVKLERAVATAVFRIFQEALTNVARHAAATLVQVELVVAHGQLHLEVADDGIGLPDGPPRRGLGLIGMQERARALGGVFTISHGEPRGTRVRLTVPVSASP